MASLNLPRGGVPNTVGVTLSNRQHSLTDNFILIASGGDGSYYAIEDSTEKDEERPIVLWAAWMDEVEPIASDFADFLLVSIKNYLDLES